MVIVKILLQRVSCATGIEQVVGNPFLHAVCLTAGEEGSIVTHDNRSVTLAR